MDREAIAWAGGLFEGEGSFTLANPSTNRNSFYPRADVSSTDEDTVRRFQQAMGFGDVHGPYAKAPPRKPIWFWNGVGFEKAQATVAMLWPWLGPRRRTAARRMLLGATSRPRTVYCSIEGCDSKQYALSLCRLHYDRRRRADARGRGRVLGDAGSPTERRRTPAPS